MFDYRVAVKAPHRLKTGEDVVPWNYQDSGNSPAPSCGQSMSPKTSLVERFAVASRAEGGKVKLVRGEWISDVIDEATVFSHSNTTIKLTRFSSPSG